MGWEDIILYYNGSFVFGITNDCVMASSQMNQCVCGLKRWNRCRGRMEECGLMCLPSMKMKNKKIDTANLHLCLLSSLTFIVPGVGQSDTVGKRSGAGTSQSDIVCMVSLTSDAPII